MRPLCVLLLAVLTLGCPGVSGAAAVVPAEGPFEGKTDEGYVVSFDAAQGVVSNVRFAVKWGYCGVSPVRIERGSRQVDANGHFLFDGGQWRFEGDFTSPAEVRGTATFLEHPLAGCPERAVPYAASLRTGPPPLVPRCQSSQLKASLYELYPGTHRHLLALRLTNRGDACALQGFPRMRLRGGGKRPLPTRMVREEPARRIVLEPEEVAVSRVRWSLVRGPNEIAGGACASPPRSVVIHLPGAVVRRFPWRWGRVCQQGELRVSALA